MLFNIQKFSIHDGQGLRTLVFFKGCPLRCEWCANPESQSYDAEIMESQTKCIGCGSCVQVCPQHAIEPAEDGLRINREKCIRCFACVERCYAESKHRVGKEYSTEELLKEIQKDSVFYAMMGGGVTFSGGEPLTHPKDLAAIAKRCQEKGIDVAVESCGMGRFEEFQEALPYINSMFFDLKHIDSHVHQELTGSGNELILENLQKISAQGMPITVRTPVVPGCNDEEENIRGIATLIRDIPNVKEYELLAYHNFGVNKYAALGRDYALPDVTPPSEETMRHLVKIANHVLAGSGKECFFTKDNTRIVER